ncbi:MAG: tetratricopeptide repeat protein [Planctomyces sp.]|nr:tetratricopeptide repeat protein [Planctomyces sp.]
MAERALKRSDEAAALDWIDRSTWLSGADAESDLLRARVYRRQGRMNDVADALRVAERHGARRTRIRDEQILAMAQSGQMRDAEPHLARLLMDPDADSIDVSRTFALGYIRTQRYEPAAKLLESWAADAPHDDEPRLIRGRLRLLQRNLNEADVWLRAALEIDPKNPETLLEMGHLMTSLNRQAEAATWYEQVLSHPRLGPEAAVGYASCLRSEGQSPRAAEVLREVLARHPDNVAMIRELGGLESELGRREEAIRLLERGAELAPYDAETRYLLAQAYRQAGRYDDARPHLEFHQQARLALTELNYLNDTLRTNPRDVTALARSGELMLQFAEPDEGVVRLLTALDVEPSNAVARRLLAEHYAAKAATDPSYRSLAEQFRLPAESP